MGFRALVRTMLSIESTKDGRLVAEGLRYRAFLSYRTTNEALASWLHRALERYRVPRALVGHPGTNGPVPRRVGRIFRDRDETRTADDIETVIAGELKRSEQLIVLCTPDVVDPGSWVPREIALFATLRPGAKIHAVIGRGEPPGIFPDQLLRPRSGGGVSEPLAADLRPRRAGGRDGRRRAVVKLVAGMLGVEFDQLWQRDVARRRRIQAAMALGVLVAAGALGYYTHLSALQDGNVMAQLASEARARGEPLLALRLAVAGVPPEGAGPLSPTSPAAAAALRSALAGLPLLQAYGDVGRPVTSMAISAGSERVAIASTTGAVFLLDQDGNLVRKIAPSTVASAGTTVEVALAHEGSLLAVTGGFGLLRTFDRDGKSLAQTNLADSMPVDFSHLKVLPDGSIVALRVNTLLIFNGTTAAVVRKWQLQEDGTIFDFDISADGRHALACSSKGTAVVWALATGDKVRELRPRDNPVVSCGFDRDGKRVFTAATDGTVHVESILDESLFREWQGPAGTLTKAVFDPAGSTLAVGTADASVYFWRFDGTDRPYRVAGAGGAIRFLTYARDGSQLVAVSQSGQLTALNPVDYRQEMAIQVHGGGVEFARASADGSRILTKGDDNSPKLWTSLVARSLDKLPQAERAEVTGAMLVTGGRLGDEAAKRDLTIRLLGRDPTQSVPPAPTGIDQLRGVEISPDLSRVVLLRGEFGEVRTIGGQLQARLAEVPMRDHRKEIAEPPQASASSVRWRLRTPEPRSDRPGAWTLLKATFSPDGRWIAGVSSNLDEVVVWDASSGQLVSRLQRATGLSEPQFSADGTLIAGVSAEGSAAVWSVSTGELLRQFEAPVVRGNAVRLSPDATIVAISGPGSVRVMRRSNGALIAELSGLANTLTFSSDGAYVAGVGWDKLRLWRVDGGYELGTFSLPSRTNFTIAFAPSRRLLALSGSAGTWVWDIGHQVDSDTGEMRRRACSMLRNVSAFSDREVASTGVLVNRQWLHDPCTHFGPFDLRRYASATSKTTKVQADQWLHDDSPYRPVVSR